MLQTQPPPATCHGCGAAQASDARFCAECGAAASFFGEVKAVLLSEQPAAQHQPWLMAGQHLTSMPEGQKIRDLQPALQSMPHPIATAASVPVSAPHKPRRWRLVSGCVAASLLAAVTVLAVNDVGTHQRLTKSQQEFSTSQSQLQAARAKLDGTITRLTGVESNLASTKTTLSSTASALAATQKGLVAKEQDLTGVRNSLTDAKSSITMKSGQIETLKNCLRGVSIALADYANGDYAGTIAALDAVRGSCDSASKMM